MAALCACLLSFLLVAPANAGRFEAGTFTSHDTISGSRLPETVTFQQPFDVPPIVIALPSQVGNNSSTIRITNVTTTGFDELALEPDNWDGRHISMVIHYIAVEPGRHVLPDGTIIEAGFTTTAATQFGSGFTGGSASWATVNFSAPLPGTPTVVHHLQTANSETQNVATSPSRPHISSIAQSLSATGFQLAIDRSQANSGPFPSAETIGWIAFPAGGTGTFPNIAGTPITWSAVNTPANIRGWDNGCFSNGFGQTSSSAIVVAKKISRNNADGGWLRYCAINASTITLRVDEDRDQDNERGIAAGDAEQAGIIAFSQAFHANLAADVSVAKEWQSSTSAIGDFSLPGAIAEYLITVTNAGNAPPNYDSVVTTDAIPGDLALVITDFGAPGSGPIQYTDGSPATGLNCVFVSLASTSDCFDFSTDGINFNYVPSDVGDGTDPAVTHVRAVPTGFMAADTGSGPTSFELRLRAKIK
ncbi:H-type lectin domain-containing protein [Pontixanthobacter aquaemixtae]|uniref:H-type lectin domain-containing protein n=1 Tax=Pontixanthobacter aquaemixtae TaxID=1958940 RepID=UPI00136BD18D|nr:H-type lectin domain-containing protein [Pontixanthobacter aquaemixtae]